MKIFATSIIVSLFVVLGSVSAKAERSCAIESSWQYCGADGEVFDNGCSITCAANQSADCMPATSFDIPGPMGMHGSCQLMPSSCSCN